MHITNHVQKYLFDMFPWILFWIRNLQTKMKWNAKISFKSYAFPAEFRLASTLAFIAYLLSILYGWSERKSTDIIPNCACQILPEESKTPNTVQESTPPAQEEININCLEEIKIDFSHKRLLWVLRMFFASRRYLFVNWKGCDLTNAVQTTEVYYM